MNKLYSYKDRLIERSRAKSDSRRQRIREWAGNIFCYFILIGIGFVYIYPLLYMLVISIMPSSDLINPTISWIPTSISFESYDKVLTMIDYGGALYRTVWLSLLCSVIQTAISALAGYALARYRVPLKGLWFVILLIVFIIPTDVVAVPRFVMFNKYGLVGNTLAIILPALLGQGIRSSLFILMFMQSFKSYPKSYDEAAQLDGAGHIKLFVRVALPMAVPMLVLTFLFSFIWYWNDTAQVGFLLNNTFTTLPLALTQVDGAYNVHFVGVGDFARINESIYMASTFLAIAPLLLLYLLVHKGLISSVESTGITGE